MGKEYDRIDEKIAKWVAEQKMFFVSTAPLSEKGLVNCSPKGIDTFRVLGERTVGYLDLTGSGVETIAHLQENGRIVIMLCAFEGAPQIIRFHGKGHVHMKGSEGYKQYLPHFKEYEGARSIIIVDVERVGDSCGLSVPLYDYQGNREALLKWAEKKGEQGVDDYQQTKNLESLDGLPGVNKK